jgi:pimeloyl-ACP methyl ester carboxylesterase
MERETLFNSPGKFKSQFATVDGYRTHYLEAGQEDARRLLLVHGGACEIGMGNYRWYPNVIPLAKRFHVYAIDELGHGQTDPPRNLNELANVRVRAEHVIKFIETQKLAPINLVGQSQGGWIVTYVTVTRPDLVKKLVLIDSGSTAGAAMKTRGEGGDREEYTEVDGVRVKVGTGELPYFKDVFEPGTMMPKEGLTTTRDGIRKYVGTFCYNKAMITEEFLDHLMELSKKWNDLYMAYKGKEYWKNRGLEGHHDDYYIDGVHLRDKVKEIKVPTLVIWGRNSNKGVDAGFQLYKRIPNAQMHIFDKANHFLWLDQVEDFNSLVTWYLTQEGGSVE